MSLKGGRPKVWLFNYGTKAYYLFLMRLGFSIAHVQAMSFIMIHPNRVEAASNMTTKIDPIIIKVVL